MRGEAAPKQTGNAPDSSDFELIQGIAEGSEESFRLLFRRWAPRLGRFLSRSTGCRETAEDLLQETFLRVLRAAPRFEPRGSVGAWLYRIGTNLVYSYWRRELASPFLCSRAGDVPTISPVPPPSNPDAIWVHRAFEREAVEALRRIPQNQRLVFLLKVDQGLTYEEIAGVLQCPIGTVKSRFHFAVRRLQGELRDWREGALAEEGGSNVL